MTRRVVCFFACLLFVVFTITALAGEEKKEKENSLHKGAWAMQFEIGGSLLDFRLYDYSGETFSGKYHLSESRALKFGIEVYGSAMDINKDKESASPSKSTSSLTIRQVKNQRFQGVCHYLWYLRENNGFHFITGLGPVFDIELRHSEESSDSNLGTDQNSKTNSDLIYKNNSYYFGLSGAVGVEYFFSKNTSLIAEYQSSAGYEYAERESVLNSSNSSESVSFQNEQSDKQTTSMFRYGSSRVKVGLSIYF